VPPFTARRLILAATLLAAVIVCAVSLSRHRKPAFASEGELRDALIGKTEEEARTLLGPPDKVTEPTAAPDAPDAILAWERFWRDPATGKAEVLLLHIREGRVCHAFLWGNGIRKLASGRRLTAPASCRDGHVA
jgi:hypothetical protein